MILSYKKQFPWGTPTNFEQKILDGTKIHTMREDPHNRWQAGRKAHHAHGVRTENYRCFKEDVCHGTQSINIVHRGARFGLIDIFVDNTLRFFNKPEYGNKFINLLAKNDGFDSIEDFFKWFGSDFQGPIIHWTDFRY